MTQLPTYKSLLNRLLLLSCLSFFFFLTFSQFTHESNASTEYMGSASCIECHEKFYNLWAPSRHGTALLNFDLAWAKKNLRSPKNPIIVEEYSYKADILRGTILEIESNKEFFISHVLGGKYVYYFLTEQEGGKLQTLPLAYDVKKGEWFDTAGSGIRHHSDAPVSWTDPAYTFNTSCYGCHVSQVDNSYDVKSKKYTTNWKENGINCETCHGPSQEHVNVYRELKVNDDTSKVVGKTLLGGKGKFTPQQNTDSCSGCHSQSIPVTKEYVPGEKFDDHYNVVFLEDNDSYPDGRDLGENYTLITWKQSPCLVSNSISCITCHTSSGRFRQKSNPNNACLPCHEDKGAALVEHTDHKPNSAGSVCISCHMVKTEFARMDRSDHSMLPPNPEASLLYGSPNACNECHSDKTIEWAKDQVSMRGQSTLQKDILYRADLVDSARKGRWEKLPQILEYIEDPESNEVFVVSLIRLLSPAPTQDKWQTLTEAIKSDKPLVRASAAKALEHYPNQVTSEKLLNLTHDSSRLVRISAASSLAGMNFSLTVENAKPLEKAKQELLESFLARADLWTSHYNMGNYFSKTSKYEKAVKAYKQASSIAPRAIPPYINLAILQSQKGVLQSAITSLNTALNYEPENTTVLYYLGIIYGEKGEKNKAEGFLSKVLSEDPKHANAARNLAVLKSTNDPEAAVRLSRQAFEIDHSVKSAYALVYYMIAAGQKNESFEFINQALKTWPNVIDFYLMQRDVATTVAKKEVVRKNVIKAQTLNTWSEQQRLILHNLKVELQY